MNVAITTGAAGRLSAYLALLARWNRVYNLTAVRTVDEMVPRHIFDSLSILPWVRGERILDVGSGAGLPGIPLAIVRPEWSFDLLDSNSKRVRFLTQAVAELRLDNARVVHSRAQDYEPGAGFDSIVSRAFASLTELLICVGRLCARGGNILAMKGVYPKDEIEELPSGYVLMGVHPLDVPDLRASRHLVRLAPIPRDRGLPSGVARSSIP
jgi:16S rRNA (guanine527-N7)-methyltransferase